MLGFTYKNNETVNDYWGKPHECYHWEGSVIADQSFGYWTNIFSDDQFGYQDDIQFKDGPTGVYWNFAPFVVGTQEEGLFSPPEECASSCTASADGIQSILSIKKLFHSRH